jgi:hypothetical protein
METFAVMVPPGENDTVLYYRVDQNGVISIVFLPPSHKEPL